MTQTSAYPRTTGIGSLPHHNVDAALHHSFQMGIPFLPQIPIRHPAEAMLAQALEGLPGLEISGPHVFLDVEDWAKGSRLLNEKLKEAYSATSPASETAFSSFEPSETASSCWQPFVWELQERDYKIAKIQIAGPLTCQWAIWLKHDAPAETFLELSQQIFQLILARSLAMVKRLQLAGVKPIIYLDEPGLYAFSPNNPRHILALQELKVLVQTLQKNGATVGIHCCSNTHWESILNLGMDLLSIDTGLSFSGISPSTLNPFLEKGGRLSLGVVPTNPTSKQNLTAPNPDHLNQILSLFAQKWADQPKFARKVCKEAIYTPACGLALLSTSEVESVLEKLMEIYGYFDSL